MEGMRSKGLLYPLRAALFNRRDGAVDTYFADFPAWTAASRRFRVLMGT